MHLVRSYVAGYAPGRQAHNKHSYGADALAHSPDAVVAIAWLRRNALAPEERGATAAYIQISGMRSIPKPP